MKDEDQLWKYHFYLGTFNGRYHDSHSGSLYKNQKAVHVCRSNPNVNKWLLSGYEIKVEDMENFG